MESYAFLICASMSIKYVSVTNVLKGGMVEIEGGLGINLETSVLYTVSLVGYYFVCYYWMSDRKVFNAIIGGLIKPSFMCYQR